MEGIECRILKEEMVENAKLFDAEIAIYHGDLENRYFAEIKRRIVPNHVHRIIEKTGNVEPLIILTDSITPKAKELLRLNNVSYVNTAGNMFLKNQYIYLLIQTNKTNRITIKTNTKAFNKAGLKVIYQFLLNPEFLNKPYRFIGEKANVTIATVGVILYHLNFKVSEKIIEDNLLKLRHERMISLQTNRV